MDENEIDEWFSARKEELSDRMQAELEKGVAFESSRARFEKEFHALLGEYDTRFRAAAVSQARNERLLRPFRRFASWREERMLAFALWRKHRSEQHKRRSFERKYQRLFREQH